MRRKMEYFELLTEDGDTSGRGGMLRTTKKILEASERCSVYHEDVSMKMCQ